MPDFLNSQWQRFTFEQEVSDAPAYTGQQNMRSILLSNEFVIDSFSKLGGKLHGLDVGCNTGYLTASIAKFGHKMTGIDTWTKGLDHARNSHPSLTFEDWNILEAPFEKKFDFIVCFNVLQCISEPSIIMQNLEKTLVDDKGAKIFIIPRPANSLLTTPLVHRLFWTKRNCSEVPPLSTYSSKFFKTFGDEYNFSCAINYRNIFIPTTIPFISSHMLVELTRE